MSDQTKVAAEEQEGQTRLMSFASGIGRFCDEAGVPYEDLAKAAGVRPEMLAPALADIAAEAAKQVEESGKEANE
jgi:hypothetical protein